MATRQTTGSPLQILASRLLGYTAVYATGTVLTLAFAVVNLAVLTRLLDPSAFGALAILTLYSGLITLVCNLGTVQGTMASAYSGGAVGEGMDDEDGDGVVAVETRPTTDNRRRMMTGFTITACVGVAITLLSVPAAGAVSNLLIGTPDYASAVVWATAAGGLGSLWRITSGLPRMERRPRMFVGLQLGRAVLVIGMEALLISAGYGLTGAVAGLVIGKLIALAAGMYVSRHRFRLAISRDDAVAILRNGRPLIVISVGFFLARNTDLFVLSRFASDADVAIYRVAERIGQMPAFAVSAALIAWGPLLRGPIRVALDSHSAIDVARSRLVSYYVYLAVTVVVGVSLWAHLLIRVAPPSYAGATDLLIVMAIAAGVHGGLTISYRMTRFPGKIAAYRRIAVVTFLVILGTALALIPSLGARGAAIASLVSALPGLLYMLWRSQRGEEPLQLSAARLGGCLALGVAWILLAWGLRAVIPDSLGPVVDVAFSLGWPVLIVVTGILPRAEVRRLLELLRRPRRAVAERKRLRVRLAALDADDRELLDALARRHQRPAEVAARHDLTQDALLARFVRLLRQLDGVGTPSDLDAEIGRYLLTAQSTPQRDRMGHLLSLRQGALPLEIDRLTVVFQRLRAAR